MNQERQQPERDIGLVLLHSMAFLDDRLILSYYAGEKDVGGLNRLKVLAIPREWLAME